MLWVVLSPLVPWTTKFENHSCILLFNWFSFVWHCILWTFLWNFRQKSSILTASWTAFIFGWVDVRFLAHRNIQNNWFRKKTDVKTHPFRFGIFWQFPLLTSASIKLENLRNFCSIRPNQTIARYDFRLQTNLLSW